MTDDAESARSRALALLDSTKRLQQLTRHRDLLQQLKPHLPQFSDSLDKAIAYAARVQRDVIGGNNWSEEEANAALELAIARLEGQALLMRAAATMIESTIALRGQQVAVAAQRVLTAAHFRDLVADRLHTFDMNEMRRQTERAKVEAARAEAQAVLAELKKSLRPQASPPSGAAGEPTIEDKIATGTVSEDELASYRARRS